MYATFVYIATVLFAILYLIWNTENLTNRAFGFAFLLMFMYGAFLSLKLMGILA